MTIKKIIFPLIFLLMSSNVFAKDRMVVFFAQSLDGISPKVIQKISLSDAFCFAANIKKDAKMSPEIESLIQSNKIEPALELETEPYFPLISSEIRVNDSVSFNRTEDLKTLLKTYKDTFKTLFDKRRTGIFLKGGIVDENTLEMFYKYNILWTTAELEDGSENGVFVKNRVVIFAPYADFPKNEKQVMEWLSDRKENVIPVILTKSHVQNESLMLYLVDLFEKSKYTETQLPVNVSYVTAKDSVKYDAGDDIKFKEFPDLPRELLLKLAKAGEEVDGNKNFIFGRSEIYPDIFGELSNMYSYDVINRILNNDQNAVKLFNVSYANIFKLSGKEVPDVKEELVRETETETCGQTAVDDGVCKFVKTNDGRIQIVNNGGIKIFAVNKTDNSVDFETDIGLSPVDFVDIYIDMNGIAYAGYQQMLKPAEGFFAPDNCWEYAVRITDKNVDVYRFSANSVSLVKNYVRTSGKISVPSNILRGNPYNWAYQLVVVQNGAVSDFLENLQNKTKILKTNPLQLKMFKYIR